VTAFARRQASSTQCNRRQLSACPLQNFTPSIKRIDRSDRKTVRRGAGRYSTLYSAKTSRSPAPRSSASRVRSGEWDGSYTDIGRPLTARRARNFDTGIRSAPAGPGGIRGQGDKARPSARASRPQRTRAREDTTTTARSR
jgi:hypothetical protein